MTLDQLIDHAIHLAELAPVFALGWGIYRKLARVVDVLTDWPPHRHTNGEILYPRDFPPGKIERRIRTISEEP